MGKGYRQGRLGEEIRRVISEMLFSGLKDPRLSPMVSITAVEVTSDGSYATCYFTVLGLGSQEENDEKLQDTLDAFNKAKGFIRNEIARSIKLRHAPELIFKVDRSMEYGRHISGIIDSLDIKHDEEEDEDEE
ncbi:MAG: 30S ribosome-binding factor RbfA [Eubacterium sp.]|nr:30S ribosome-binding factor RbfA [Candidatus Colimonas fimequi]